MTDIENPRSTRFYHGTKADLEPGDLIVAGHASNYGRRKVAAIVYLTATLDAAIWGAELAVGDGPGRIHVVELLGPVEDVPNLTDKKLPATRRARIARGTACVSRGKLRSGRGIRPSSSRPCVIIWSG
jgi:hypothetical protein